MQEVHLEVEPPTVMFKKRANKSKAIVRRAAVAIVSSDSELTSSEDEEGRLIKRRRKNGGVTAKSTVPATSFSPDMLNTSSVALSTTTDSATKASNWFDENEEKPLAKDTQSTSRLRLGAPSEANSTYKGQSNYQSFIQKNPDAPSRQVGPIKSSTNVRTITVIDFAPDVCKDYKTTGYCGFGDNCKFLHAREDFKQGWELDRDWEIGTKGKKIQGKTVASADRSARNGNGNGNDQEDDDDDDALLESIPFACVICKKPYTNPIITKCAHYFCEACALQRYRKTPSCAACGAGTGGVFNVAKKLSRLLDKKRERVKKRKEEAVAMGEEISGSEDGASD